MDVEWTKEFRSEGGGRGGGRRVLVVGCGFEVKGFACSKNWWSSWPVMVEEIEVSDTSYLAKR